MSTTITDVTELQAMEDDLTEDYILGNNINAAATSGWNGGLGFDPIGIRVATHYAYAYPTSDLIIEGSAIGTYPDDGVYWNKVDDTQGAPDDDSTYNHQSGGAAATFVYGTSSSPPATAYDISVRLYTRAKCTGTNRHYGILRIGDTNYLTSTYQGTSSTYSDKYWTYTTNPSTNLAWTISDIPNIQGFGWWSNYGNQKQYMTQIYLRISYKLDYRFSGSFDGKEYTISDLFINRPTEDEVGLFGVTDDATIENVTLSGVDITGLDDVGALIGYMQGGTVTNCHSSGTVSGGDYIGGLIGYSIEGDGTTISECSSSCTVSGDDYVGGLLGAPSSATISECYTIGSVSGNDYIGGFTGWSYLLTISQCYSTGDVSGTDDYVGGFAGVSQGDNTSNCYARGDVSGDRYIGGLIGYSYSSEVVTNCYSTGAVTGNTDVGGLLGYSEGTITNCFWDITTSGQAASDGGTGKTTAQMKTLATFYDASWDIAPTATDRNDGYPFLSWEIDESGTIWLIYGTGLRSFTIPDILDHKGRPVKNARVQAFRVDTHKFVEEELTDEYGSATFDELPNEVDVVFTPTWGGLRTPRL